MLWHPQRCASVLFRCRARLRAGGVDADCAVPDEACGTGGEGGVEEEVEGTCLPSDTTAELAVVRFDFPPHREHCPAVVTASATGGGTGGVGAGGVDEEWDMPCRTERF